MDNIIVYKYASVAHKLYFCTNSSSNPARRIKQLKMCIADTAIRLEYFNLAQKVHIVVII